MCDPHTRGACCLITNLLSGDTWCCVRHPREWDRPSQIPARSAAPHAPPIFTNFHDPDALAVKIEARGLLFYHHRFTIMFLMCVPFWKCGLSPILTLLHHLLLLLIFRLFKLSSSPSHLPSPSKPPYPYPILPPPSSFPMYLLFWFSSSSWLLAYWSSSSLLFIIILFHLLSHYFLFLNPIPIFLNNFCILLNSPFTVVLSKT